MKKVREQFIRVQVIWQVLCKLAAIHKSESKFALHKSENEFALHKSENKINPNHSPPTLKRNRELKHYEVLVFAYPFWCVCVCVGGGVVELTKIGTLIWLDERFFQFCLI